ncbi:MAG: nucleotidyltransferase family protein [Gammaproteobacteria bacterium]|nr:nucleotidyltransferase family protein [Gammaproteobacteria bacterium]
MRAGLLNRFFLKKLCINELSEKNWELLIRQAKSANLAVSLANQVLDKGYNVPVKAVLHLDSERILTLRQIEATQYEFEKLIKVFSHQEIKAVLLKGAAYIAAGFEFANHRKLSDIDILVDQTCIPGAERELIFYGWVPQQVDDYDKVYYREWMHEIPPLIHRKRGSVIDLHHNIFPPISGISPNSRLLMERAVYMEDIGFWRLSNEDMLIHSAVHFFCKVKLKMDYVTSVI